MSSDRLAPKTEMEIRRRDEGVHLAPNPPDYGLSDYGQAVYDRRWLLVELDRLRLALKNEVVERDAAIQAVLPLTVPPIKVWPDGEPCDHPGCLYHASHPCEGCGRIGGRYALAQEEPKP